MKFLSIREVRKLDIAIAKEMEEKGVEKIELELIRQNFPGAFALRGKANNKVYPAGIPKGAGCQCENCKCANCPKDCL